MVGPSGDGEGESSGSKVPHSGTESTRLSTQRQGVQNPAEDLGSSSSQQQFQESILLSPGFRSAAALAGWDAETLLIAALNQSPVDSGAGGGSSAAAVRKRDKRTPLNSARRHRKGRWEGSTGHPLWRLPMKPLTHLSDNELELDTEKKHKDRQLIHQPALSSGGVCSGAEGKENCDHSPSTCDDTFELKGKDKEKTPMKPPCLDQLRDELSCAVCLDICFEPSTISCGHSFCGTCLQSVLQKCGPRCPKCRQALRSEALKNCRINTVLWNTIQILFPKETSLKIQDQQRSRDEEAAKRALKEEEHRSRSMLGTRPSRLQPWRGSAFPNNVNRISVMGNLRTSFQTASEMMGPSRQVGDDSPSQRQSPPTWISREDRERQSSGHIEESAGIPRSQSRGRRRIRAVQGQDDAALAARLQAAELNPGSELEEILIVDRPRQVTSTQSHPMTRPRYGTVALAASNLRTVASRAVRQQRARNRS